MFAIDASDLENILYESTESDKYKESWEKLNSCLIRYNEAKRNRVKIIPTFCYQEGCSDIDPFYVDKNTSDDDIEETIRDEHWAEIYTNPGFRSFSWRKE